MPPLDPEIQAHADEKIREALIDPIIPDGCYLTGWILCYEYVEEDGERSAGYVEGVGTTNWQALGLMEWSRGLIHNPSSGDVDE